MNKLEYGI